MMQPENVRTFDQLHNDVYDFIDGVFDKEFSLNDVCRYYDFRDGNQRRIVDYWLRMAIVDGLIERSGKKWGWFRKLDSGLEKMDFVNADESPVDLWLPFNLSEKVNIHEGNLIIVAGAPNAGKTAVMLNIIRNNMHKWKVHLFDSESDAGELKGRLKNFDDISIDQWCFDPYKRVDNFADVIFQGPGNLNVVDFLEIHDEFYIVGRELKKIKDALRGAVAIVGLQKNDGAHTGLGGNRMLEVARLSIGLDRGYPHNRCTITKAKNRKEAESIDGLYCEFKLAAGCRFLPKGGVGWDWYRKTK